VAIVVQVLLVTRFVPLLPGRLPMAIGNYTAAAYARRWPALGLALVLATEAVIYARIPEERAGGEVVFAVFVALGTWSVGDVVRQRLRRAERVVDAAQELVAEREAAHAAALVDERARIAHELHDVIAHSVSVMGVQAGAARTMIDSDPDAARAALRSVEATARSAVDELRRLLAVLREPDTRVADRAPQPGLGQLPALVEKARSAGLPVELSCAPLPPLPAGVDLAAYRIVQEALTNAIKHAHASTTVRVAVANAHLHIEVRDHGPGCRGAGRDEPGHGLIGMQERAHLYGGTVRAGDHPDGGFLVAACLPTGAAEHA
jgi:signal transduction histidine kinase